MGDEKDAFYVVRKGDVVGIYKSLADCQPLDHSTSVYKGYDLSKEAESYLLSRGLKQAHISIGASDVQDGLFGALSVCPFQVAVGSDSFSGNSLLRPVPLRSDAEPQHQVSAESSSYVANSQKRPIELGNYVHPQQSVLSSSVQGKWKTKNENMANLCKVAKELAKQFISFTIEQVPREFNTDADAQANRAITLRDGQIEMEVIRPHA